MNASSTMRCHPDGIFEARPRKDLAVHCRPSLWEPNPFGDLRSMPRRIVTFMGEMHISWVEMRPSWELCVLHGNNEKPGYGQSPAVRGVPEESFPRASPQALDTRIM